jgi:RHS repeat-associated protein
MIFAPYCQTSNFTYVAVKTLAGVLQDGWDYVYDSAGNIATTQTSTGPANPATITKRSHNNLNQIDTLGGGGMTTIRGTLDEPGRVSVGITDQGDKPARMIESNRFEIELPLEEGSNSVSIAALDGSHNRSDHVFSIQVTARGAQSFSYDTNGNLESDGVRGYEWDSLSRLKKITWAAGKTTEFKYNALGQRCERIETDGATVTKTYHLFDGITPIDRRTGTEPNTAAIDRRYFEQGEQRLNGTSWDNFHYCRDHLGSVREVVNSYGTLVARYDFAPYGKRITQYQDAIYTGVCDIGYTGHVTVPSLVTGQTEMVLTHFRVYDTEIGRWLSADPIGEAGGINIYAYCHGNPHNLQDPDGMFPSAAWWGGFLNVDWDHGTRDALKLGAMATVDGFIPWKDPFKNAGKYGECEDGAQFSQAMGGISREAALLATGAKIYQVIGSGVLKSSGIAGASALEQGAAGRAGVNALFVRQAFLEAYKGLGNTAYTVAQASKAFLASEYGLGVYDRLSDVRDPINESFKDCDLYD